MSHTRWAISFCFKVHMKLRYPVPFIIILLSNQVKMICNHRGDIFWWPKCWWHFEYLVLRSKKAPVFIRGTRHRQRLSRPQSPDRTKVRIGPLMKSFETRFDQNDDLNPSRSQSQGYPDQTLYQCDVLNHSRSVTQGSADWTSLLKVSDHGSLLPLQRIRPCLHQIRIRG